MAVASEGMRQSILRRCALLVLAAILLFPAGAAAAEPVYVQYACHLPDGTAIPADGFESQASGAATVENRCASGGGLTIEVPEQGPAAPINGKWSYTAPPSTLLSQIRLMRKVHNFGGNGGARTLQLKLDGKEVDACAPFFACEVSKSISAGPGQVFETTVNCYSEYCSGADPGYGWASLDSIAITLLDESPPTFRGTPGGDLFSPSPVDGTRSVSFTAEDAGGGVYKAAWVIDDLEREARVLDPNEGACAKPFVRAVPCKTSVDGRLMLDTTTLTDGEHTISVAVYDATEVNRVASPPVKVEVRNSIGAPSGSSISESDPPAASSNPLGLRLLGRPFRRGAIRQQFGRSTLVQGRLVDREGRAVPSATLTVLSAPDVPGGRLEEIGAPTTNAEGQFSFQVPPGVSRRLVVRSSSGSWTVRVRVAAPLRLQPSRTQLVNKQKLLLVAYLLGARVPAGSADVAFQVRIGHQWRTFATRPIGRDGRAQIAHRFRVTFQRMTYHFRAVVVRRKSFPFGNAASPSISVQVN